MQNLKLVRDNGIWACNKSQIHFINKLFLCHRISNQVKTKKIHIYLTYFEKYFHLNRILKKHTDKSAKPGIIKPFSKAVSGLTADIDGP